MNESIDNNINNKTKETEVSNDNNINNEAEEIEVSNDDNINDESEEIEVSNDDNINDEAKEIEINNNAKYDIKEKDKNNCNEEVAVEQFEDNHTDIGEVSNELNKNNIDKKAYLCKLEEDCILYGRAKINYVEWHQRHKEIALEFKKLLLEVEAYLEIINKDLEEKKIEEQDKKIFDNRVKGINMIGRMIRNVMKLIEEKITKINIIEFEPIKSINYIEDTSICEIEEILNHNYNIISNINKEKDYLIKEYFKLIEINILPISDGIYSGITFIGNSKNESINNIILPIYESLEKSVREFLSRIKVKNIKVKKYDSLNFNFHEVIDIEITNELVYDEKIESIVREGYEYLEDIYNTGINHSIREAQVVAYKFKE